MEEILIPEFQRQYVWKLEEASRFIESVLLGLPVPNVFLAKDKETFNFIIVDGLQRLMTLYYFRIGSFPSGKRFALKGVDPHFNGLSYETLPMHDRRNFDDYTIHATIVSESDNSNRMFHIFERLNTSGTPLTSQEIRSALYHGPLNLLLKRLVNEEAWRALCDKSNLRMESEELILRFIALHYDLRHFRGSMKEFLNHFMYRNRSLDIISEADVSNTFIDTMEYLLSAIGSDAFKMGRVFNYSFFDAVSYSGSMSKGIVPPDIFKSVLESALEDEAFVRLTRSATTSLSNVMGRIEYFMSRLGLAR
jgi:uncharacterized protein with ParB-like and HNH nuclease domain